MTRRSDLSSGSEVGEVSILPAPMVLPGASNGRSRKRLSRAEGRGVGSLRLGCKPFQAGLRIYLESRKGIVKDSTLRESRKKLAYIGNVLEGLQDKGEVMTTDPRHISRADVQALMGWMKQRHLDPSTQRKYLFEIKGMLGFFDNFVFEELKAKGVRMPRQTEKPIPWISEDDFWRIMAAADRLRNRWHAEMCKGAFALWNTTMVRHSELRLSHFEDLDIRQRRIFIRYPKGEASWASPEWVGFVRSADFLPWIERYLDARQKHLEEHGVDVATALFPNLTKGSQGFYSLNSFNKMKRDVEELSGVEFKIKDFRSSSASTMMDLDPKLQPLITAQLRHKNPGTTLRTYARVNMSKAAKQLDIAWNERKGPDGRPIMTGTKGPHDPSQANSAKKAVIRRDFGTTGYA